MHGTAKIIKAAKAQIKEFGPEHADLIAQYLAVQAREDFWKFRQLMHPGLVRGWWAEIVAYELQAFYEAFKRGERPKLLLCAPPQHGKSMAVTDFLAWVAGKDPKIKEMFASYSDTLGQKVNGEIQRILLSPQYRLVFPNTRVGEIGNTQVDGIRYQRNSSLIEFVGNNMGSFRNTTVAGQINGIGFDLGCIDDPIKGRLEANSKRIRDTTWDWLTDDFFGRFSEMAALLMILTRWHIDDPGGRFIAKFPMTRVVAFPAVAVDDEMYRLKGEALFPQHKSLSFLMERKQVMTKSSWESQYQQSPIVVGGGMFPIEKFEIIPNFDRKKIKVSTRYWDKAGTQDGGAYTCGVLLHQMYDDTYVIESVVRGQWTALVREQRIRQTAEIDGAKERDVDIWIEQEPGSGGKESAENTVRLLRGFNAHIDPVRSGKEYRAEPYAAQVQGGNVRLLAGDWNQEFIDEHEEFPSGKYKDQVDAASGAFNKTVSNDSSYDTSMSWVTGLKDK